MRKVCSICGKLVSKKEAVRSSIVPEWFECQKCSRSCHYGKGTPQNFVEVPNPDMCRLIRRMLKAFEALGYGDRYGRIVAQGMHRKFSAQAKRLGIKVKK